MELLINLIPLAVILVLLFLKQHMLFAGLVGGAVALVIGGFSLGDVNGAVMEGIKTMFSYTAPILFAAAAMMVAKGGSVQAVVQMAEKAFKGKIAIFAGILVLIQAAATYMAGMGAGNTMVIAPLVAMAVGAVPEVVAAMAIVTAVGFTTSPASTETVLAAEAAGIDVIEHAANMQPLTLLFVALGVALAIYGVSKRGVLVSNNKNAIKVTLDGNLFVRALPAIALLTFVILGSRINGLIGFVVFTPVTTVMITAILTAVLTPLGITKTSEALIDGSRYILTTLFGVGIFLSFINLIARLGTFEQLAGLVANVPTGLIVPSAIIMAFLIAIPSGAFAAGVLVLILPTLSLLGMPSQAMGFVAIAVGFGTQISPVQINVAALSEGFGVEILQICKNNLKFVLVSLALLIALSFVFI
ncbi:MAG: hypothetical protein KGZ51_04610 [Erysipelothrix sp.]|jgi:C4-dicarboxylate transporter|nr:hypothetical protein [Erysipelothrix sp.]